MRSRLGRFALALSSPQAAECGRLGHAIIILLLLVTPALAADGSITGRANPALAPFDELMTSFMQKNHVPGGALAVTRNGRLVYARGFGYADVESKTPVQPNSLFRIASVSKPFTAVAILQLVEKGKLKLDDKAIPLLKLDPLLVGDARPDPRLNDITIQQLLNHTAGWDRSKSFDPMFRSAQIARMFNATPPATPEQIIRYMLGRPLDFDPGQRHVYSNFGYCILGRLIECTTGQTYEDYVRQNILKPLGIDDMRLGHTLASQRAAGEVRYYSHNKATAPAIMGPAGQRVALPYGVWCLESMDSHGGWIASAPDLVRFAAAFDDPGSCRILDAASIATMFRRPPTSPQASPTFYACGWMVRPVGRTGKANTWHNGRLDGTSTLLVRRYDGLDWAVLFNSDAGPDGVDLTAAIDPLVHRAADAVKSWQGQRSEVRDQRSEMQ